MSGNYRTDNIDTQVLIRDLKINKLKKEHKKGKPAVLHIEYCPNCSKDIYVEFLKEDVFLVCDTVKEDFKLKDMSFYNFHCPKCYKHKIINVEDASMVIRELKEYKKDGEVE